MYASYRTESRAFGRFSRKFLTRAEALWTSGPARARQVQR
jgi:hypothetical protein